MVLQQIHNQLFSAKLQITDVPCAWLFDTRQFCNYLNDLKELLSDEEKLKSEAIRNEQARSLYCLRKGLTRVILGRTLQTNPAEITFGRTSTGKPFISNHNSNFRFNISHSKEYLFIGIIENRDIGVDIEKINPKLQHSLLAEGVFSPFEKTLYNNYDSLHQLRSFYKAWVQKEAISKALGVGISMGFDLLSVHINPYQIAEQYTMSLDNLECSIRMNVKFENDYLLATALVE